MEGLFKEGSLGSVLLKSQIITEKDIGKALAEQNATGCRFGEALVNLGIVAQEDIDWALSNQLNIPYVRLKEEMIDQEATEMVTADVARQFNLIPLIRAGDELTIAIADPLHQSAIDAVEQMTGCRITISVALIREIREMQDVFYGPVGEKKSFGFVSDSFPAKVMGDINADLTGAKFLDYLLLHLLRHNLTALSLQPLGDFVRVIARRSGFTREIGRVATNYYPDLMSRIRKLTRISDTTEVSATGSLGFRYKNENVLFQVMLLRCITGDYVTLRQHISASFPEDISALDFPPEKAERLRSLLTARSGLVLISGRDGIERCRFMDLLLDEYDCSGKTVLALGAGFGCGKKRYSQVALQSGAQHDSQALVMALLEHEPDVLAIEDITESNAFIAAHKAAVRGKLVVAGASFSNAAQAFKHLLFFRHKNYFIPANINGLIICKGVLILCPHCKKSYDPAPEELAALPPASPPGGYFRTAGCPACHQTGYSGKKYLVEVIPFDKGLLDAFASQDGSEVLNYLHGQGNSDISKEGARLWERGEISPGEFITSILL